MEQAKVTVVIPVYNVEKYLDRCVESVVSQTYPNLEIILVDDGSTDRCPEICDDWAGRDSRVKVIHKANAGLGMARNSGIEQATGTYIFFFDSDDYVDVTTVEKCVRRATENHAQAVLYGSADAFEDGRIAKIPMKLKKVFFEKAAIHNELLPGFFTYSMGFGASCCMKMFSLDVIRRHHICFQSERELISEDAFFVLEYFTQIERACVVPENLYFYYKRTGSLTKSYREDRQTQNNRFLKKALDYVDEKGLPDHIKDHIMARYHMYTIAALKHLAKLPGEKKKQAMQEIFRDPILHSTLDRKVLKLHKPKMRMFFSLLKWKAYPLCKLLLSLKG